MESSEKHGNISRGSVQAALITLLRKIDAQTKVLVFQDFNYKCEHNEL